MSLGPAQKHAGPKKHIPTGSRNTQARPRHFLRAQVHKKIRPGPKNMYRSNKKGNLRVPRSIKHAYQINIFPQGRCWPHSPQLLIFVKRLKARLSKKRLPAMSEALKHRTRMLAMRAMEIPKHTKKLNLGSVDCPKGSLQETFGKHGRCLQETFGNHGRFYLDFLGFPWLSYVFLQAFINSKHCQGEGQQPRIADEFQRWSCHQASGE